MTSSGTEVKGVKSRKSSTGLVHTIPPRPLRESISLPNNFSAFLEGKGYVRTGSNVSTIFGKDDVDEGHHSKPYPKWIYHVVLLGLMLGVIGLVTFSLYLELTAYLADIEWNRILDRKRAFPPAFKGDVIFGGKNWTDVSQLFPPSLHPASIPDKEVKGQNKGQAARAGPHHDPTIRIDIIESITRRQNLETTYLVLTFASVLCLTLILTHYVIFACYWDWWKRLHVTYLGHGLIGLGLIVAAILLIFSTLFHIPRGLIHLRTQLEDEVGNGKANKSNVEYRGHFKHHHHDWPFPTDNCVVNGTVDGARELQNLLDIVKMCVYGRYIKMNAQDPCGNTNKWKIKKKVTLTLKEGQGTGKGMNYSLAHFEKLGICPMDEYKMLAMALTLAAGLTSLIIMWIGSYASKAFFPHIHAMPNKSLFKPGAVSAIEDLTSRGRRSTQESLPASLHRLDTMNKRESVGTSPSIGTRRGFGSGESRGHHHGVGDSMMSIMQLAPQMVIRPQHNETRPQGSTLTPASTPTTQEKHKQSEWFTNGE